MRTINFRTDGKTETIAARLQAEGYIPVLKCYEYQGEIRLTMQWDRREHISGVRVDRHIWLTDDGFLAPEVYVSGSEFEGTQTVDVEAALAEIERLVSGAMAEAAA